jgi:hypothetical protein
VVFGIEVMAATVGRPTIFKKDIKSSDVGPATVPA